jgi:hypothetical protein
MARTPREMVEGLFTRWNLGVAELPRDEAHPDIEVFSRTSGLRGRPYRGYIEVEGWIREMFEAFEEWTLHGEEFEEVTPDRLLVTGTVQYRPRGSAVAMSMPSAWIFDFEGGRCIRLETFSRRVEEAREAALR